MPVEFSRLFASETWVLSNDAEKVAALTLWGRSWHESPAGSLPQDERMLAHISGARIKWKRVRAMAMRGWLLCGDGRYYHSVVCEKALEAWLEKLGQRIRSAFAHAERYGSAIDVEPLQAQFRDSLARLAALNPHSRSLSKAVPVARQKQPGKGAADTATGTPPARQRSATGSASGMPRDRDRDRDRDKASIQTPARASNSTQVAEAHALALREIGYSECSPMHPDLVAAAGEGVTPEELVSVAKGKSDKPIAYLVAAARGRRIDAAGRQVNGSAPPALPPPDPQAVARAKAEQMLDDELRKIRHDCDTLGLTEPEERDRRLAAARERARQASGGSVSCH